MDPRCPMEGCTAVCTLGHVLNNCQKCLDRYEYRHNSCLAFLVAQIVKKKPKKMRVLADLPGLKENGGTVPHSLAVTGQQPDIVIIDESVTPTKVVLLELTCPFDSAGGFEAARLRKVQRYERLTLDIQEVGSRGVISERNRG